MIEHISPEDETEVLRVIKKALSYSVKNLGSKKIIAIDFDEDADILYVKFSHSKIVDTKP